MKTTEELQRIIASREAARAEYLEQWQKAEATIARQSKIIDEVYRVLHEESFLDDWGGDGQRVVFTADIHAVLDGEEGLV